MKLKKVLLIIISIISFDLSAQTPEMINYQAIIRDVNNTVIVNQSVKVKFTITQNLPNGTVVFEEEHTPTTNSHGLVNLKIGTGNITTGSMTGIAWGVSTHYLTTSIDPTGGSNFTLTGVSQLISVPYALHAKTVDNTDDADADPTNEIEIPTGGTNGQVLKTDGLGNYAWINQTANTDIDPTNEIEIPTGGTNGQVLKTDGLGNYTWVNQTTNTQLTESEVDAFVSNNGFITSNLDNDPTNEIEIPTGGTNGQVLQTNGSGIYTWVNQTVDTDTDTQLSEATVDAYANNNGYLTTEVDGSITNEIELPVGGTSGQVLQTDGTGNYSWVNQSGGGSTINHVGEHLQGGIIVFVDSTGIHGLIASLNDIGTAAFENGSNTNLPAAQSYVDGSNNTAAMVASPKLFDAANLCDGLTSGGFTDWYLPSVAEMQYIFQNGYVLLNFDFGAIYWTSTQSPGGFGFSAVSYSGTANINSSSTPSTVNSVRAMRQF